MHEIRHWAQIGTLLRLTGLKGEFHDFLFSPVLGGELKPVGKLITYRLYPYTPQPYLSACSRCAASLPQHFRETPSRRWCGLRFR